MPNNKFITNLRIGFGVSLLILLGTSAISYYSIRKQIDLRENRIKFSQSISAANNMLILLQNAETGVRGYQLTGKDSFLEPYRESLKGFPVGILKLNKSLTKSETQRIIIQNLEVQVKEFLRIQQNFIRERNQSGNIIYNDLENSKNVLDICRSLIDQFVTEQQELLDKQSQELAVTSERTSMFILISAFASLLITLIFYIRLRNDFSSREKLQKLLREKEEVMDKRIHIVQKFANDVVSGNYEVHLDETGGDELGEISIALNKITSSLRTSFEKINHTEWRQLGLVKLNEFLVGNKTKSEIVDFALEFIADYTNSLNAALYDYSGNSFKLLGAFGIEDRMKDVIPVHDGVFGQVLQSKKHKLLSDVAVQPFRSGLAHGDIIPSQVLVTPVLINKEVDGVFELSSLKKITDEDIKFILEALESVAIAIKAAESRSEIQQLLEETQTQTEELQMQHAELENLNTELELQADKLQVSEEELRVQQEELVQSNYELGERAKQLEDKNQLIALRNVEIQEKAEELALSTKYKSEFLANMSHELRTPLNSILLLSRLLSENTEENLLEDQVESAKVIQSSGTSLLTLIDEILDLSKIEAGKMDLDYQRIQLSDVVNDLRNLFLPLIKENKLHFEVNIQEDVSPVMEVDRLRLEQVLRNLLSNAIKFTKQGTISLLISKNEQKPNFIDFTVKDTGIGIPKDKQKLIFEAFQQADGSTRRKFGGTGLGLSISREIARLFGGEIFLKSAENEGSAFTLSIPVIKPEDKIEVKPKTAEILEVIQKDVDDVKSILDEHADVVETEKTILPLEIPQDIPDDRNTIQPGDKVILIVEDDTAFAQALLKFTRQNNYKGIVVVRGDQAMPIAEKYVPLAILLDIQLPVKSGWEVMDEIKNNPKTRHIPVHIMSSLEVKKESLLKGAIDFINKPVAIEQISDMFKKIEDALSRSPKKVLIVEENSMHANALSYYLSSFNIGLEVKDNVEDSIQALRTDDVDCVILDMGVPDEMGYKTLEAIKQYEGFEHLPIIIFTGKNLSKSEEFKIRQYADSIVIKTAHSYQRILDEVGLFLHLVDEKKGEDFRKNGNKMGALKDVLSGKKILIADDDVRNIFSLTKALERYNVQVISAIDGKEAVEQLLANPDVAVVLMDMMMPEKDGYEAIQEIRKINKFARLPIISVTAKSMIGDREKCIQAGASDYISKPVDIDQLLSLLRVWLYQK